MGFYDIELRLQCPLYSYYKEGLEVVSGCQAWKYCSRLLPDHMSNQEILILQIRLVLFKVLRIAEYVYSCGWDNENRRDFRVKFEIINTAQYLSYVAALQYRQQENHEAAKLKKRCVGLRVKC